MYHVVRYMLCNISQYIESIEDIIVKVQCLLTQLLCDTNLQLTAEQTEVDLTGFLHNITISFCIGCITDMVTDILCNSDILF